MEKINKITWLEKKPENFNLLKFQTIAEVENILGLNNSKTSKAFDESAETYDEDLFTRILFLTEKNNVLKLLDIQEGDKILDLGTGTGKYIKEFLKNGKDGLQITGIDLSEKMIENTSKNINNENVDFQVGNILDLSSLAENSFDKVNCAHVLKFLLTPKDLDKAFKEIYRILKPGGTFVFTNNHPERDFEWDDFMTFEEEENNEETEEVSMKLHKIEDYEKAIKKAGFSDFEIKDVLINENTEKFIEKENYNKTKGKKIIISMKITK